MVPLRRWGGMLRAPGSLGLCPGCKWSFRRAVDTSDEATAETMSRGWKPGAPMQFV